MEENGHFGERFLSTTKPCFVFAVCGAASHLDEMHMALSVLRRHSRADICVVTDSRRNEIPVVWPDVVDVETPAGLDNHQASIYLKTRLHRLLPIGPRYCYLDSDVLATSPEVDGVFSVAITPLSFAADQIRLHQFSPYAVCCGCMEKNAAERFEINAILEEARRDCMGPWKGWDAEAYERNACNPLSRLRAFLSHLLTPASASQAGDPQKLLWRAYWYEFHSKILFQPEAVIRLVESSTGWRRDRRRNSWISPAGNNIFHLQCDHLVVAIREIFGVPVTQSRWQLWNGGVFLFDERGHAFLDAWHEKTMRVFSLPGWRTRDQGTLVATVWEFGLQDQSLLPSRFNCILDARMGGTMISRDGRTVTTDAFLSKIRPALAHVLKRDSNPDSDIWRWVRMQALPTPLE